MQITISARHGHLSPQTQQKITEKVEKLQRFFDRVTAIDVTVNLEHRDTPSAELRVSAEHADNFVATDQADSLLAAIDSVMHKVESQLRKHKEKLTGHRSPGLKHLEVPSDTEPDAP